MIQYFFYGVSFDITVGDSKYSSLFHIPKYFCCEFFQLYIIQEEVWNFEINKNVFVQFEKLFASIYF